MARTLINEVSELVPNSKFSTPDLLHFYQTKPDALSRAKSFFHAQGQLTSSELVKKLNVSKEVARTLLNKIAKDEEVVFISSADRISKKPWGEGEKYKDVTKPY